MRLAHEVGIHPKTLGDLERQAIVPRDRAATIWLAIARLDREGV